MTTITKFILFSDFFFKKFIEILIHLGIKDLCFNELTVDKKLQCDDIVMEIKKTF